MDKTYAPVTTAQELTEALAKCRAAQEKFATYTQEQVDKIFLAAATAANQMRIPLAKQAVAETGMGVVEDKVIKNHYAAEYIYNAYKDTQTVGVLERDEAFGMMKVAEPIGVVAAVIPTTNPTSTAIFKTLICLKTRNGIIISPHPRAKGCTIAAARVVLEAAVAAGAPEGIIAWIDKPSLELTNQVMREADLILATGGPGMVKAAYSSGKPALGVGAGNTPAIIDESADVKVAVNSILHSKTFDNGMICASEQSVVVLDSIFNRIIRNRKLGKNTWLYIDEIYLLFQHEYSANFLFTLWKRMRKYGACGTGLTQNVDDLLQSHTARTMLANSEFLLMLNQASTDRIELARLLNISDNQLSYISGVDFGHGLLKCGSTIVPFVDHFPKNGRLYQLMTTKLSERVEQAS